MLHTWIAYYIILVGLAGKSQCFDLVHGIMNLLSMSIWCCQYPCRQAKI